MSLVDLLRSQLLDKFRKVKDKGGAFILIYDDDSKDMLENYGDIQDAMDACGASYADKLLKKRRPRPDKDILYFIKPSEEAMKQINEDFKNPEVTKYRKLHLLFTAPCPNETYSILHGSKIEPKIITKQEINVDIYVGGKNVYHFNKPEHNQIFFYDPLTQDVEYNDLCSSAVEKLKTLFVSLGDYPQIYYMKSSPHPKLLSLKLQNRLEEIREDEYISYPPMQQLRNRPKLLVIDRTYDLIAPIIHEFTYQAMAYDLLGISNDVYKFTFINNEDEEDTKEALLNENDPVWTKLKYQHIKDVSTDLRKGLDEFKGKYESVARIDRKEKTTTLVEMNRAVKNVSAYNEEKLFFSLHMRMADECLDKFAQQSLNSIGNIEQDMACGVDPFGDKVSQKQISEDLKKLWESPNLQETDKLRILMMYCLYFSAKTKEIAKLAKRADLSPSATQALHTVMKIKPSWLPEERKKKRSKLKNDDERPYDLSRWKPRITELIGKFLDSALPPKEYLLLDDTESFAGYKSTGYVKSRKRDGVKSLKCRKQPSWAEKNGNIEHTVETKLGDRFILYILGGISYSELREIHSIALERESDLTIIGCAMLQPRDFVKAIETLNKDL